MLTNLTWLSLFFRLFHPATEDIQVHMDIHQDKPYARNKTSLNKFKRTEIIYSMFFEKQKIEDLHYKITGSDRTLSSMIIRSRHPSPECICTAWKNSKERILWKKTFHTFIPQEMGYIFSSSTLLCLTWGQY